MYDRTTWIVLIVCGGLLALNFHFSAKNEKARAQYLAEQRAEQAAAAAAAGEPFDVADPAARPVTDGLTVEPPPPPTEERLVTLANDRVTLTLTTWGGGIKFAEFQKEFEVGSSTERVRANRHGAGAIGAFAGAGDLLENTSYQYREDLSVPNRKAVFVAKLPSGLLAKKTYTLNDAEKPGSDYLIEFGLVVENAGETPIDLSEMSLFMGEAHPLYQREYANMTGFFWRESGDFHFRHGGKFTGGWFSAAKPVISNPPDHVVQYAGVANQFFATVIRPAEPAVTRVWARAEQVLINENARAVSSVRAGIHLPKTTLAPGQPPVALNYQIFIGPKHNPMLRRMNNHWGEGWSDMMQYGVFGFVSRPLNWLLNSYQNLIDGIARNWSWGLAIIFLTITVRIFIWPLHAKSTRTMKRMSKLQPEMAKLKEKYGDDPAKLNTEMMGLYRKFGINPLGGCLPMLLQLPIFFGFFRMLQYAVELRGQGFLWVSDLSQPDTLAFVFGIPINILPIVMGITSFLQIAITPKTGDKMQQRIIMFMPLIFFIFCYNFASALALYWTVQNIFSIGQTWLMNKMPEPALVARSDGGKKSWVQRMADKQAEMQKLQQQRARQGGASGMRDVTPESKKKRPPRTGG
ncbi:MAG: membrane protein insertase YidC [Luteolibacter sp.]